MKLTFLQIKYVIACVQAKSMTKVAKAMLTTTSNISRTIKALEDELGYEIFIRHTDGIQLTEKGKQFLTYASIIQDQCSNIENLNREVRRRVFSCACMHMPFCYMAFEKLCNACEDDEEISLRINTGFLSECVDAVAGQSCEIGIISVPDSIDEIERTHIAERGLSLELLADQTLNVNVRKGHPVLEGFEAGGDFDFSRLYDYPYISRANYDHYVIHPMDVSHPSYLPAEIINPRKNIYINDSAWKAYLIGHSNAFGVGTRVPDEFANENNWVTIPLPGYISHLYLIHTKGVELSEEARMFVSFLREILASSGT